MRQTGQRWLDKCSACKIGTMPMFLGLTHRHTVAEKKRIARNR